MKVLNSQSVLYKGTTLLLFNVFRIINMLLKECFEVYFTSFFDWQEIPFLSKLNIQKKLQEIRLKNVKQADWGLFLPLACDNTRTD